MRSGAIRFTQTRPNQPTDLTRYIKKNEGIPTPKNLIKDEAQRLGVINHDATVVLESRPVPKDPLEAVKARVAYRAAMNATRAELRAEVAESNARLLEKEEEHRAQVRALRDANALRRKNEKAERAIRTAAARQIERNTRDLRQAQAKSGKERQGEATAARRREWLDALEAEALASWIPEDKIDTLITPDLFATKLTWQYELWFEAKEKKRAMEEALRRAKKPNEPLRELLPTDAEYARDIESESEDDAAAEAAVHERYTDAHAAACGDPQVAIALTAARRAARAAGGPAAGVVFEEPDYDDNGRPLLLDNMARTLRGAGAGVGRGLRLEELFAQQQLSAAEEVDGEEDVGWGRSASDAAALRRVPTPEELARGADLPLETLYIGRQVRDGNVPAVVYALLRKRARLSRCVAATADLPSGPVGSAARDALAAFESAWGGWLSSAMTGLGAAPASVPVTDALFTALHSAPSSENDTGGGTGGSQSAMVADLEAFALSVNAQARANRDRAAGGTEKKSALTAELENLWAAAAQAGETSARPADAAGAVRAPRWKPNARFGRGRNAAPADDVAAAEDAALDGSTAGGFQIDSRNVAIAQAMAESPDPSADAPSATRASSVDASLKSAPQDDSSIKENPPGRSK